MDNAIHHKKSTLLALALLAFIQMPTAFAGDDTPSGHWYMGASASYLTPDSERGSDDAGFLGMQGGYQINDRWAIEAGVQKYANRNGLTSSGDTNHLSFVRGWGEKYRVLMEFGYTHTSLRWATGPDDATGGFHVGAGLSAFVTKNIELRADVKEVFTPNEATFDNFVTVSLNWHFNDAISMGVENNYTSDGGNTEEAQSLQPLSYREAPVAEEAVVSDASDVAPAPVEPVVSDAAPAPVAPSEAVAPAAVAAVETAVPAEAAVVAPVAPPVETVVPVAAASQSPTASVFVSPTAVPKSTHTLLNFGSNSLDLEKQYGGQLDQLSQEIKSGDSKAVIEGHTDSKGSSESNKTLSLDRAIVVKRELKNRGVNSDKLRAVGMGEDQPVTTNDTAEGRAQNRRVEVKIYDNQ